MRFRQVDPHRTDRTVRTGCELDLLVARLRIPEEVGVVVVGRIPADTIDLPLADRKRIVRASDGGGIARDHDAVFTDHLDRSVTAADANDRASRLPERRARDVPYINDRADAIEFDSRVELLEKGWTDMELLAEGFGRVLVAERGQLRLVGHVLGYR